MKSLKNSKSMRRVFKTKEKHMLVSKKKVVAVRTLKYLIRMGSTLNHLITMTVLTRKIQQFLVIDQSEV